MTVPMIRPEQTDAIRNFLADSVPEALTTLRTVMNDGTANSRSRVDAAKALLDRAGVVALPPPKESGPALSPAEMTADELRALLDAAAAELAGRATPVNAERITPPSAADFLD